LKVSLGKYIAIVKQSKYVLLLNITDKLFSFIIFLMLARTFPAEIYGSLVTLLTMMAVIIAVFDLGLPIFLQREVSIDPLNSNVIFSKILATGLFLFIFYLAGGLLFLKLLYPALPVTLFLIVALVMYSSSLVTLCNKVLSGLNDFKNQFISFSLPRVIIVIMFAIGIYMMNLSLNRLMLIFAAGVLLNILLVIKKLKDANIVFSFRHFTFESTYAVVKLSIPLGLAVIFNFLYDKIDVLLIAKMTGFDQVAYYNIGYGLFKSSSIAFSFLLVPALTKVASMREVKVEIAELFREYFFIISIICAIVTLILFYFSRPIITALYSHKFESSVPVLQILAFGIPAMGLNNLAGVTLNGMGYFKVVMYITLYALVFNVILNIAFIPVYGIMAPGVLTVITEYFILFTELYYLRRIFRT
jgi:stage V sporulation protein B